MRLSIDSALTRGGAGEGAGFGSLAQPTRVMARAATTHVAMPAVREMIARGEVAARTKPRTRHVGILISAPPRAPRRRIEGLVQKAGSTLEEHEGYRVAERRGSGGC